VAVTITLLPLCLVLVGPRTNDRMALNGILYVLTSGCRWCDMPAEYCSYKTAWRRLRRWVYGTVHSRPWPL
jgi:transposase